MPGSGCGWKMCDRLLVATAAAALFPAHVRPVPAIAPEAISAPGGAIILLISVSFSVPALIELLSLLYGMHLLPVVLAVYEYA